MTEEKTLQYNYEYHRCPLKSKNRWTQQMQNKHWNIIRYVLFLWYTAVIYCCRCSFFLRPGPEAHTHTFALKSRVVKNEDLSNFQILNSDLRPFSFGWSQYQNTFRLSWSVILMSFHMIFHWGGHQRDFCFRDFLCYVYVRAPLSWNCFGLSFAWGRIQIYLDVSGPPSWILHIFLLISIRLL